ncbi:MAG: NF038129 family PEP-CTERM protein [Pseudomonadota bacterium]|nr:NF038129 family PEP-CTERM protein [Pseudomonadota bacterium]
MFNLKNLLAQAMLVLSLGTVAGAALAVPVTYHVNVDTSTLSGAGLLDLAFIGAGDGASATAFLSHFTGSFGDVYDAAGAVSGDVGSSITFSNTAGDNYLTQMVQFGSMFGFDIRFDFAESDIGTTFAMNLYLPGFTGYAFGDGALLQVDLNPAASIALDAQAPYASIAAVAADVPEPGQWAIMLTGLLLIGGLARRRAVD